MNQSTLEAEIVEPSNAIALRDKSESVATTERKPMTAQELRTVEVNEALLPAYQRAATLEMTDAEIEALTASFPDEAVEIRPHDGLIYIPHIHISNRFSKVLKPGKWAIICRRHWLEGNTMYGEHVLVIRGCYIGEAVGGHPYQPNNPKVNYSDTLESTAAEALRRIAGKRLSCGSQVWEPEYARQWVAKYAKQVGGKWVKVGSVAPVTTVAPKFTKPDTQIALTCPIISLLSSNGHHLQELSEANTRPANEAESKILLQRVCQRLRIENLPIPESFSQPPIIYWHKGGDLGITGRGGFIGEGIRSVPCFIALVHLRFSDNDRSKDDSSGSNDRVLHERQNRKGETLQHEKESGVLRSSSRSDPQGNLLQPSSPATSRKVATVEQRQRMIETIEKEGPDAVQRALGYFIEAGALLPNETMKDLPLYWVPATQGQFRELGLLIAKLNDTGKAEKPAWAKIPINPNESAGQMPNPATAFNPEESEENPFNEPQQPELAPQQPSKAPNDDQWWRKVIVPIPHKGQKRADYLKNPDTIGSLFDARHDDEDARKRLFGFASHFEPKPWTGNDGKSRPPSKSDIDFRRALDAFADFYERNHNGEEFD